MPASRRARPRLRALLTWGAATIVVIAAPACASPTETTENAGASSLAQTQTEGGVGSQVTAPDGDTESEQPDRFDSEHGASEAPPSASGSTAASGDAGASDSTRDADGTGDADGTSAGFCAAVAGIEQDLAIVDVSSDWDDDPQRLVAGVIAAAERFATTEPPEPIAESWQGMSAFLTMADAALGGVDPTDAAAVKDALRFEGEEAFGMALRLPGDGYTVGVYVQQTCGIDLGLQPPVIANVCAAMDPASLELVFDGAVPDGDHRTWGAGVVECVWDDRDGTEVGIVVGPVEAVRPDLVQGQEPIDAIAAGGGGEVGSIDIYDGALGPLRLSSGRTAATEMGGSAVLVSVRTGDLDADETTAAALAGQVAAGLE